MDNNVEIQVLKNFAEEGQNRKAWRKHWLQVGELIYKLPTREREIILGDLYQIIDCRQTIASITIERKTK